MVEDCWRRLPDKFPGVLAETFIVMPNHLHALVGLTRLPDAAKPGQAAAPLLKVEPPALSRVVRWFKTMTTNGYFRRVRGEGWPLLRGRLWQRNYYEHIVRTPRVAQRIAAYILENPQHWELDVENPRTGQRHPDPVEEIIASDL
jgi:putative transposase